MSYYGELIKVSIRERGLEDNLFGVKKGEYMTSVQMGSRLVWRAR